MMNLAKIRLLLLAAGGSVFLLTGCTALSQKQLDERDYRRLDFEHRFRADRRRCLARGGKVYVDASRSVGRRGVPARGDNYSCV